MVSDFMFTVVALIRGAIEAVRPWVGRLVAVMLALDFTVYGIHLASGKNQEIGANILKLLATGVMVWVIMYWDILAATLLDGFLRFAARVGDVTGNRFLDSIGVSVTSFRPNEFLDPSAILGFARDEIILPLVQDFNETTAGLEGMRMLAERIEQGVVRGAIIGGVLVAFFIIAVQVAIALIEFWVVILFSLILVPFSLWKPVSFIGEKSFSAVVGQAIKLGLIAVTTGIVLNLFRAFVFVPVGGELGFDDMANILLASFLCSFLVLQLPKLAGSLLSGMPQLSANAMFQAAAGVIAGAKAGANFARQGAKQVAAGTRAAAPVAAAAAAAVGRGASTVLRAGARLGEAAVTRASGVEGLGVQESSVRSVDGVGVGTIASSALRQAAATGAAAGPTPPAGAQSPGAAVSPAGASTARSSNAPASKSSSPTSAGSVGTGQAGHAVRGRK